MIDVATRIAVSIFLCIVLSVHSDAAEVKYELRAGAARSDNVARSETAEIVETFALVGLKLDLQHESKRVGLSFITDLEHRRYLDDTFDNETVGALNADLVLQLAPDVLSWTFEDRFRTLQTNPFQPDTAANREFVNSFSTGPDLRLRLGSLTAIEISGRYRSSQFERSNVDNDVQSGRLTLVRTPSAHRSISLNATADKIEFDNTTINRDYDRLAAFIGFDSEISNGTLSLNVGVNEVREDNGVDTDGNLYAVSWTRGLSTRATFKLGYYQGLSYASDTFVSAVSRSSQEPGRDFSETQQTAGVSDPFENRRISAGIDYQRNTISYFVSALYNEDDYLIADSLDRDRTAFRIGFAGGIGSAWQFRIAGSVQKTDFVLSNREDDDKFLRAGLSRQFSSAFSVNLDYTFTERNSNVAGIDYVENVVYLTFSFAR